MPNISIRTIQPGDNPTLAHIIRTTLVEFGANHPGTVYYDPSTDHLFELFQQPGSIYLVGENDGQIKGGCGIFPSKGLPTAVCELVKMYLIPAARGIGLGKELIRQALDFARKSGYEKVYIETMPELKKAMTVYEKFGFRYLNGPMGNTGHTGCTVWMLLEL